MERQMWICHFDEKIRLHWNRLNQYLLLDYSIFNLHISVKRENHSKTITWDRFRYFFPQFSSFPVAFFCKYFKKGLLQYKQIFEKSNSTIIFSILQYCVQQRNFIVFSIQKLSNITIYSVFFFYFFL